MSTIVRRAFLAVLTATSVMCAPSGANAQSSASPAADLGNMIVTARRIPEKAQNAPVAITTLSAERIEHYSVTSLEKLAEVTPGLIITRGNSGSGAGFSLRGIGSNFSSIGIEQSVAVVVDDVYYGQGRIIDESFVDLERIEILKGPQSLFFGKNSTAGVISITTAQPGPDVEAKARLGYEYHNQNRLAEAVLSGPVTDALGLRLVVAGQNMAGGYVRNDAGPGSYPTIDAATGLATFHAVPSPDNRDLPGAESLLGRLTATYQPTDDLNVSLKISANHDEQAGTSWNNRLWKCPSGFSTFPGNPSDACGESFSINQNPAPPDIAATREDMGREGGELYTEYDSYATTAQVNKSLPHVTLTSITNYQRYKYANNSDYDFTSLGSIWADQHNSYRAVAQEARARSRFEGPLNFLLGLYYQDARLDLSRAAVFFGSENSLAARPDDRYVTLSTRSATEGQTWAGYGQVIWNFLPEWEFTAGARYTAERKDSYFIQPYVNPFFAALYVQNRLLTANQRFHEMSPESTLAWKPDDDLTFYASFRTGYKSGGFSNSANDVVGGAGVANLAFEPETVKGAEAGAKAALLDRQLHIAANVYRYEFSDLQVDFFNAQNFALITTNAGSAISDGVDVEAEYLPPAIDRLRVRGMLAYNRARYEDYIGPCYTGQTQAQGCNVVNNVASQNLSGKPTADAPRWLAAAGIDYERRLARGWAFGASVDMRYSDSYSVNPFAQPQGRQESYLNFDAGLRAENGHWQFALIGKNLSNNFVVTYATDFPATGTAPGGATGQLADQLALFAPPRTVTLQVTYNYW
jgi:iron complex outermembrane recepter protein